MDEPGSRNSSLQRKKPPWLKLDIPTIQLTPDDSPTHTQVKKKKTAVKYRSEYFDYFYFTFWQRVCASLSVVCVAASKAPAQRQYARGKPSDLHGCLGNFKQLPQTSSSGETALHHAVYQEVVHTQTHKYDERFSSFLSADFLQLLNSYYFCMFYIHNNSLL